MASHAQWGWDECKPCFGRGKSWPRGSSNPAARCEGCRGLGRVCTHKAGPVFDEIGQQVPGKLQGTHPLGDCEHCWGIVQAVFEDLLGVTTRAMDDADKARQREREFEIEMSVNRGHVEAHLKDMEQRMLMGMEAVMKRLPAPSAAPPVGDEGEDDGAGSRFITASPGRSTMGGGFGRGGSLADEFEDAPAPATKPGRFRRAVNAVAKEVLGKD